MSRLTKRTPAGLPYLANAKDNEQAIDASKHTCECLLETWIKLADYEDIGPPSDLIRPVRCGECRFAGSRSLGEGLVNGLSGIYCGVWKDFTDRDTYCSRGERRQSE